MGLDDLVNEGTPDKGHELSPGDEAAVRAWLDSIGEEKDYEIRNVLDLCKRNPDALAYFLRRASGLPE